MVGQTQVPENTCFVPVAGRVRSGDCLPAGICVNTGTSDVDARSKVSWLPAYAIGHTTGSRARHVRRARDRDLGLTDPQCRVSPSD